MQNCCLMWLSVFVSVRLLKAFQIDFSWYRLSSWINLTEQWPLRASMIVLQHDQSGENLDDIASLQSVYEKYVSSKKRMLLMFYCCSVVSNSLCCFQTWEFCDLQGILVTLVTRVDFLYSIVNVMPFFTSFTKISARLDD